MLKDYAAIALQYIYLQAKRFLMAMLKINDDENSYFYLPFSNVEWFKQVTHDLVYVKARGFSEPIQVYLNNEDLEDMLKRAASAQDSAVIDLSRYPTDAMH